MSTAFTPSALPRWKRSCLYWGIVLPGLTPGLRNLRV